MKRKFYWAVLSVLVLLAGGCVLKPKMIAPDYRAPKMIAVLPLSNQSNDVRGPEYIRKEFIKHLAGRGYDILASEQTDEILRTQFGITDGGQLKSTTPQKLCAALGVDGVIYGDVLDFKFQNVGFYINKYVEADFKMVDKDGRDLWEDRRAATRKEIRTNLKDAGRAMARGVAEKAVGNMLSVPLYEQVQQVVRTAVSTLPRGR